MSAGRYDDAISLADDVIATKPDFPAPHRQKAAAYAMLDRPDEARREVDRLLELRPDFSLAKVPQVVPLPPEIMQRHIEALRKAGLPE